ncbi:uncharacterized protein LOC141912464 [Tubulanus polymorphus]|uniref:uncharacterized protein LOC141912464 n=1 Tax=Tubulanus polymorphus TaxID=672921 RepID=UPI003DA20B9E
MASKMSPVYSAGGASHVNQISPQPQTVMMSAVPQQPIATSNRRADGSRIGFAHHSARYCGIIQIVCGFILLIIGILTISSGAIFHFIGYGFWGSILCFVAGGLGLHGSKTKNNCPIIGTMVMSIFTCMLGFVLVGFSAADIEIDARRFYYPHPYHHSIHPFNFGLACHVGNILVGIVLIVVPIIQSCVSCRAICCPTSDAYILQQSIIYTTQQQSGASTQPGQIVNGQPSEVYGQTPANQPPTAQMPDGQASADAQLTVAQVPPTGADDVEPGIHGLPSYNEAFTGVESD